MIEEKPLVPVDPSFGRSPSARGGEDGRRRSLEFGEAAAWRGGDGGAARRCGAPRPASARGDAAPSDAPTA